MRTGGRSTTHGSLIHCTSFAITSNQAYTSAIGLTAQVGNTKPFLTNLPGTPLVIDAGDTVEFWAIAGDSDPAQLLTYELLAGDAAGARIHPYYGLLSWTPDSSQPPGEYSLTIRVSDNGKPILSEEKTLKIKIKSPQTLTFPEFPSRTFGDAPSVMSATASSGLPVTLSLVSGPATLAGDLLTVTAAGTVLVRASQGGDSNYSPAPDVERSLTVEPAELTSTGAGPEPGLWGGQSGVGGPLQWVCQRGDGGGVERAVEVGTSATAGSPVGSYPIWVREGSLSAANYRLKRVGARCGWSRRS